MTPLFCRRLGFAVDSMPDLRLAAILRDEYEHGFAPGSRCAMVWPVSG
jgi:hypothetical protein